MGVNEAILMLLQIVIQNQFRILCICCMTSRHASLLVEVCGEGLSQALPRYGSDISLRITQQLGILTATSSSTGGLSKIYTAPHSIRIWLW